MHVIISEQKPVPFIAIVYNYTVPVYSTVSMNLRFFLLANCIVITTFPTYQSLVWAGTDLRDAENAFLLPLLLQTGTGTSESDPEGKKNAHGLLLFLVHEQLDYNKNCLL